VIFAVFDVSLAVNLCINCSFFTFIGLKMSNWTALDASGSLLSLHCLLKHGDGLFSFSPAVRWRRLGVAVIAAFVIDRSVHVHVFAV